MEAVAFDETVIVELKELMGERFGELCRRYIDDGSQRLTSMREAITEKTVDVLRDQAHSLKGASANVGALRLSEQCHQLEQLAADANWDNIPDCFANVEQCWHSVRAAIDGL